MVCVREKDRQRERERAREREREPARENLLLQSCQAPDCFQSNAGQEYPVCRGQRGGLLGESLPSLEVLPVTSHGAELSYGAKLKWK